MYSVPSTTIMESHRLVKNFALTGHTDNLGRCSWPHLLSTPRALVLAAVTNPRARKNVTAGPAWHVKLIFNVSHRNNCSLISCNSHGLNIPSLAVLIIELRNVTSEFVYKDMPCLDWDIFSLWKQCLAHCLALAQTVIKHKIPSVYAIWVNGLSFVCSTKTWIPECGTELCHQIDTPHDWQAWPKLMCK